MCGIAGIVLFDGVNGESEALVARMITQLRHRGPDETGLYRDQDVCLGHARLSIVGLQCGIQPIGSADERYWIVYNGEAFNYIELQEELEQKGYRFTTGSDTEVVLALYQEYGPAALSKINGQFAIAIWDRVKRELFLARDRVGIRPLYYTSRNGQFSFASEIKAIFADQAVPRRLDEQALSQIFTFWTTITPHTAFTGVVELPPGNFMIINEGGALQPEPFWQILLSTAKHSWQGSFDEAVEELQGLLKDAVRLRLRADVPVGAYLSGGLDSSIITTLISRNFNNRLRTFSLTFQENHYDESGYQQELISLLNSEHSEIRVGNQQIRDTFPEVVKQCETPLLRTGPVPLYALSRLVRDSNFKVVLTGEGADEVFGGYNIYKEAKFRHFWARQPQSKCRPLLVERLYPYIFQGTARAKSHLQQFFGVEPGDLADPFFSHQVRWRNSGRNCGFFSAHLLDQLNGYDPRSAVRSRLPAEYSDADWFSKAQFLEMDIFLSNYLLSSQGDRVGMGNSIELRLPFLDYRVIAFAAALPAHWKIRGLNEKYILKKAFAAQLPEAIGKRAKQPYRAPIREAFPSNAPDSWIAEMLSDRTINACGYFDAKKVAMLAKRFHSEAKHPVSEVQNMALIGILSTHLLHRQFIDEFSPTDITPTVVDKVVRKTR